MSALQQSAPQGVRTDLDLALERAGSAWDRTAKEREAFALVAQVLECTKAQAHIEAAHRRRSHLRAAPDPAPMPGPRPKPTPATPPLLHVVPGYSEPSAGEHLDVDDAMFEALAAFAQRWRGRGLVPSSVRMLEAFQDAADRVLRD